ncbi:hypothetical protein K492DRAFT_209465 [Lichtheimia hyalospora FSU 10163]|nr:hypothetical protein K492DRAFT_209465 [Lichtheimia hyalospora FSU 10163]
MEEQKPTEHESTKSPQTESSSPLQDNSKESPVTSSATSPPPTSGNESNPTTSPESPSTQQQQETTHEQSPQQQSPQQQEQEQQQQQQQLSEPVRTLKEAFPDIDVEVIEAILASQGGQMERSFEVLLGMSDPNYKPEEPPRPQQRATEPATTTTEDVPAPPMPPRPTQTETQTQAPYGYWQQQQQQQQQQQEPRTVEEQMQMDEAYARQLALEDERVRAQRYQRQQQQQAEDDQPLFNFQEDLPIIKERVVEAGNAAKKKVMDLYNQFKASRANNGGSPSQGTSMPTTNAQYRGLPSDDGDDLLAGDVSALHLSDNDVYAQTARPQQQQQQGVIHVNPPYQRQGGNDTVDAQIRADEELARRLAGDDQFWESNTRNNNNEQPPQMPPRRTPSPAVQHSTVDTGSEGDSVVLTAPESTKPTEKSESRTEERRSYVIRDEDDSDDDDLIDVDEESERKDTTEKDATQKPDQKVSTSPK